MIGLEKKGGWGEGRRGNPTNVMIILLHRHHEWHVVVRDHLESEILTTKESAIASSNQAAGVGLLLPLPLTQPQPLPPKEGLPQLTGIIWNLDHFLDKGRQIRGGDAIDGHDEAGLHQVVLICRRAASLVVPSTPNINPYPPTKELRPNG